MCWEMPAQKLPGATRLENDQEFITSDVFGNQNPKVLGHLGGLLVAFCFSRLVLFSQEVQQRDLGVILEAFWETFGGFLIVSVGFVFPRGSTGES